MRQRRPLRRRCGPCAPRASPCAGCRDERSTAAAPPSRGLYHMRLNAWVGRPGTGTEPVRPVRWPTRWPTRSRFRSRSSSRRSGPSSTGSVVTFDPASLKARLAELEEELNQPDFWNDQQRAARLSSEHQRALQKFQRYNELCSNVEFLQEGAGTFPEEE